MFLSAIQTYVIAIIVAVVALQYAFALFCLLKLAYFDIPKNKYILWNLLILIVFFIGGAVFLVYYYKHPDKRISKQPAQQSDPVENAEKDETTDSFDKADEIAEEKVEEQSKVDDKNEQ